MEESIQHPRDWPGHELVYLQLDKYSVVPHDVQVWPHGVIDGNARIEPVGSKRKLGHRLL